MTQNDLFKLARADFPAWLKRLDDTVERVLIPGEERLVDEETIPADLAQPLKDFGLFGMTIPERFGGLGLGMVEQCLATIAVTRAASSSIPVCARRPKRDEENPVIASAECDCVARPASFQSGPKGRPDPQDTIKGRRPEVSSNAVVEAWAVARARVRRRSSHSSLARRAR